MLATASTRGLLPRHTELPHLLTERTLPLLESLLVAWIHEPTQDTGNILQNHPFRPPAQTLN